MDSYNTPLVSDPSNIQLLKRIGRVVEIDPESVDTYRTILADENPQVRDLLKKHQLRNFSMFLSQQGDRWFVFSYCEYAGRDYETDMAALASDAEYQEWIETCQAMHVSAEADPGWRELEQIFFNP
jgi:L-rhamnose mutarotase